ncbi:hypothetical protein AA313_de0204461 [Arthrobotrys entomopaga]|nr:hypothetical protein AA313_de0204461 [Arthrobotrys entomopaga]
MLIDPRLRNPGIMASNLDGEEALNSLAHDPIIKEELDSESEYDSAEQKLQQEMAGPSKQKFIVEDNCFQAERTCQGQNPGDLFANMDIDEYPFVSIDQSSYVGHLQAVETTYATSTQPESPPSMSDPGSHHLSISRILEDAADANLESSEIHDDDMSMNDHGDTSTKERAPKKRIRKSNALREKSDKWINCGYPGCQRRYLYLDKLKAHRLSFHGSGAEPKVKKKPRRRARELSHESDTSGSQEKVPSPPNKKLRHKYH